MKLIINFNPSEAFENTYGSSAPNIINDELLNHKYSETRIRQLVESLSDDLNLLFIYSNFEVTD